MTNHFGFPLEAVIIFLLVVALSIYFDLFTHRKHKEISFQDAALWSFCWIGLALEFYVYLWWRFDKSWADLYLAGYVLEKSLSVDNLMVFMAIFASFGIRGALQHRILYWGIVGAMLFRAIFITAGTALFHLSPWVGFIFGAVVAWTGWKMLTSGGDDEEIEDYSNDWSVRLTKQVLPIFPRLHLEKFLIPHRIVEDLKAADPSIRTLGSASLYATPAFLCMIAIETCDLLFSFDSVPAVIAVTREPLLVYAAMIFAILGLRSLYFVLAALTRYLVHLEKAVVLLLFFIAAKLIVESWNHVFFDTGIHISPTTSLVIVLLALTAGVVASFIFPEEPEEEGLPSPENLHSELEEQPGQD